MTKTNDEIEIDSLFGDLAKEDDSLATFSDNDIGETKDWVPTLIPSLDKNLVGGIPASGEISEIFGAPSSGKSTFAGLIMHNAQKMGIIPIYFDVETTQKPSRLIELGVDPEHVLTVRPKRLKNGHIMPLYIEDIGQKMIDLCAKVHDRNPSAITMFIWDSVAMTQPKMTAEADIDQQLVGQQAKALATIGRKLQVNLKENNGFLLAFNQARDDFSAPVAKYAQVKTIGGKGWYHLLSTQILFKQSGKIRLNSTTKEAIGHETRVSVPKSKIGDNATDEVTVDLIGKLGFDIERNIVSSASKLGIIKGSNWMTYITEEGEEVKIQGKVAWTDYLKDPNNIDVRSELWKKVLVSYFPECYPPLFNLRARLTVEKFPEINGLRKYYSEIQEELPEEQQDYNYKTYMKAGLPLD
ncbi:recombinase A [Lactobacillus phage LpeD]|uniref:Recombinase A n=1 Tax=Lactobacillus phage LpeD TaxID=2041210 RepID=A0A291I9I3_9CAUD|nr:UvsX-like recombinase [Lactobacillus phage LpeD]ATG86357.1 recombinase A [Lactobacillus phage LpeD]